MSFIIKKASPNPLAKPAPKSLLIRPAPVQSPFKTNIGGEFPDKNVAAVKPAPAAPVASKPVIRPKAILPVKRSANAAQDAGIFVPPTQVSNTSGVAPIKYAERTGPLYPAVPMHALVTITNNHFPWVKHYKPGDIGKVKHIGNNRDPMGIDDTSHLLHVVEIIEQCDGKKDRIGQTAALFRWEFNVGRVPKAEWTGKLVMGE